MQRFTNALLAVAITIASTGCAVVAPQYTASIENVQALKDSGNYTTKVTDFQPGKDKTYNNPIVLRSSTMTSPYNDSYASYVAEALKQELSLAKKLSADANTEITGTLLRNDIEAAGVSIGTVDLEARFVVKRGSQIRYDQVKSVRHEYPSAFAAAVAIPKAVQEYPVAVQKLLNLVYSDKSFIEALK